jgi:hypothetical protein
MRLPLQLALSLVPMMLTAGDRFTTSDALALPLALDRFVADDQRAKYEAWIRAAFGPGAVQLGLSPRPADDLDAETMRADLFDAAAWLGRDPELVKQAVAAADHWRDLRVPMRGTILAVAVDASPELFERVLRETKTEPDRSRRDDMVRALATVRDPKRAEAALQLLLDPALDIRDTMWMLYATTTPATRQVAEAFYRAHEAELLQRLPQDEVSGGLGQTTELFTSACDPRRRDEVREFATKHFGSAPGGARVVDQALETMEQCLASRTMLEPQVRAWLGGYRLPRPDPKKTKPGTKK